MEKILKLKGLDCADCAAKIERKLNKLDGIKNANINFLTEKLILEIKEDKITEVLDDVKGLINKLEPNIEVKEL